MKVIGAGFMRTGTLSTQAALQTLGYPCYHMKKVPEIKGHLDAWLGLVADHAPMDWKKLFRDYEATVDMPACVYYEELMQEFPDAKVLLNVRDPDKWYDSFMTLRGTFKRLRPISHFIPKLRKFVRFGDALLGSIFNGDESRENCIKVFNAHNETVQQRVPEDRLLVFRVQDGWEPLCEFLGCEVPNEPFPHLNEGDAIIKDIRRRIFIGPWARRVALAAAGIGAAVLGWQLLE